MGAVQSRLAQLGISKQSAFGSAMTTATYVVGVTGGSVYNVELEENELDTTWSNRILGGYDRVSAVPVVDTGVVVMPKSVGLLLLLAFGADAVTGSGPYTHVFSLSDPLPYCTLFGKFGSVDSAQIADSKLDSIEFEWDKTSSLTAKIKAMGCGFDPSFAFPTVSTNAEVVSSGTMRGAGGAFTVDGTSARVTGGSIKVSNNLDAIQVSSSVTPLDMFEAKMSVEVSLKIKPTDMTFWRKIITGTTSGTTIAGSPLFGSFSLGFTGPSSSSLVFASGGSNVAWTASLPDADPNGGAAELAVTGRVVVPASGSAITATLINSVATY